MSRGRASLAALSAAVLGALVAVVVMPALTSGAGPVQAETSTEPPGPTVVTIDPPATPTGDSTPTFTFSTTDPTPEFQCAIDQTDEFSGCSSPFTPATELNDGEHTFNVHGRNSESVDEYGPVASATFTVDTVPPTVSIDSGPANG